MNNERQGPNQKDILGFVEPFNGEQNGNDYEKESARLSFKSLVDDILSHHLGEVEFDHSGDIDSAEITLEIDNGTGSRLIVEVSSVDYRDDGSSDSYVKCPDGIDRSVTISKVNQESQGGTALHRYDYDPETGYVSRRDKPAVELQSNTMLNELSEQHRAGMTQEESDIWHEKFRQAAAVLSNDKRNIEFEKEMGLNDSTVTVEEIDELRALLSLGRVAKS